MKTAWNLLLALVLCLSLCACMNTEPTQPDAPTATPTAAPTVTPTQPSVEPTVEPTVAPTDAPTQPTEAPTQPTETPTQPTDPTPAPTEPPVHTHSFGNWKTVKAATCTEKGTAERTCACGEKETKEIAATGHVEVVDKAVAATCTQDGMTEGKHCSVCNAVLVKQEVVKAKGHTEVTDAAVAATCTQTGLTEGKHCSVCNAVLVKQETVATVSHTYENGVCVHCGLQAACEWLFFELNSDGESYSVVAIATNYDFTDLIIPNIYQGKPVTKIGDHAFSSCKRLKHITIPDSVTEIGKGAFSWCTGLSGVTIGNSVTKIGQSAFSHCINLYSITFPNSLTEIGWYAFWRCEKLYLDVYYNGTIQQWEAIDQGKRWAQYTHVEKVHCTDGDVHLPYYAYDIHF